MSTSTIARTVSARLHRGVVLLLAVATGLSVANNYYSQPLLHEIGHGMHLSSGVAGLVVTAAQIGYAAGLVFLLPLGDLLPRRRLVTALTAVNALALVVLAASPTASVLLGASVAVGTLSVVAQILVPYAAALAGEQERGRVVGTVMSGLLLGILLARTASGYLSRIGGWQTVYWVAAVLMVILAVAIRVGLPALPPATDLRYPDLLRSVVALVRDEPVLRLRMAYGGLSFAMFSVLWTSLTFLLSAAPYHYSASTIGLFGLVGAAGALGAGVTGRLADRGGAHRTTTVAVFVLLVSWLPLWLGGHSVVALLIGLVIFDLAAQMLHISNQSEIYRLRPEARSRLNSAYMTSYFTGGALGSALSSYLFALAGWPAVTLLGATLAVATLLVFLATTLRR